MSSVAVSFFFRQTYPHAMHQETKEARLLGWLLGLEKKGGPLTERALTGYIDLKTVSLQ